MKKRFAWIATFIVALSLVFSFVGCDQQANPVLPSDPEIKLEPIGFKITLPSANLERAGYYTQEDASKYVVELTKDGEEIEELEGKPGYTLTFTVTEEGTYTINVFAYNAEDTLIAEGSSSKEIKFGDGFVNVVITLTPMEKPQDPSDPIDPSPVDPIPPVEPIYISVDIQWGQPEPCTLTVTTPTYFTSLSTGENLGSSLTLEFISGTELWKIFADNDVEIVPESFMDNENYLHQYDWHYYDSENEMDYWHEYVVSESLELSAVFKMIPQVTFNLNGGNVNGDTSDVVVNTDYFSVNYNPVVTPTKEGFVLIGWTLTPDGDDIVEKASSNITVYAKWADPLKLFDFGDIIGDFAGDGLPLVYEGAGIYTAEFVYQADMNVWGSPLGTVAFKLRPTAGDWNVSYGMVSDPILDTKEGFISISDGDNIVVSGLVENFIYKVTVRCTEYGDVYVKIDTVGEYTPTTSPDNAV